MLKSAQWQSIFKSDAGPWLVLFAGLIMTAYASHLVKIGIEREAYREFAFDCDEVKERIVERLQTHKQVLLGGAALFDASKSVDRDQWREYAARMQIDQHFRGIQGLGFSLLIPKQQLSRHIDEIRKQGFPEYNVSPAGERDLYSSIIYLEPFKDRNLRAFGYDMYSEPVRRVAMEQARDENVAALSGKVVLVQETGKDVQAGTLMYIPVYGKQMPTDTVEQRRAALIGWVYSPFRMDDLLRGVLKGWSNPDIKYIHLKVYDGQSANPASLLYDSQAGENDAHILPQLFELEQHTDFNGRVWTLRFDLIGGSTGGIDYSKAWVAFAAGLVVSFLLFILTRSYANTWRNAQSIADTLTEELHRRVETERALNEELRASSQYSRSLIEASLDPLVTISSDGKITDVNEATVRATGVARKALIGSDFSNYFTEPEKARAAYREAYAKGFVTDYPLAIRHASGNVTYVLYNASLYRDEKGEAAGVFAAARDITELKRTEEELRNYHQHLEEIVTLRTSDLVKANERLEATNKELESFSYSISHDLRVPLRAIDGFSRILLEDYSAKLDAEGQRVLNVVCDSTVKMAQLIDDILAFSGIGRGEMILARIDMDELVHVVLEELEPVLAARKLTFDIKPLASAQGDKAMIRRVWTNLIDNAVKFTALKSEAVIEVGSTAGQEETIYYVKDNGAGFDMQYANKLFGAFQRLHGAEFAGAGIGLAIVKRIVARHGGRVWAEGKVNEGATFYFTLPVRENSHD
jgi:PAS domain S-box-containing protein